MTFPAITIGGIGAWYLRKNRSWPWWDYRQGNVAAPTVRTRAALGVLPGRTHALIQSG